MKRVKVVVTYRTYTKGRKELVSESPHVREHYLSMTGFFRPFLFSADQFSKPKLNRCVVDPDKKEKVGSDLEKQAGRPKGINRKSRYDIVKGITTLAGLTLAGKIVPDNFTNFSPTLKAACGVFKEHQQTFLL